MPDQKDQQPSPPRVKALSQLRNGFAPERDLWPAIEQRIAADQSPAQSGDPASLGHRGVPMWMKVAAAAIVLVGVGVWIGHAARTPDITHNAPEHALAQPVLADACVNDAQFLRERSALLSPANGMLSGLPPDSRVKVVASLQTIHDAVHDIESALAGDSTNPLLQELLLTTCQDEIRVLTEVQAAGRAESAERGI